MFVLVMAGHYIRWDISNVIINYKSNKVAADETLNEIISQGGSAELMPFDVSNKDETENALENWKNNNSEKLKIGIRWLGQPGDNYITRHLILNSETLKQELQDFIKRTINDVIENRLKEDIDEN